MRRLLDIARRHRGKVSDKWESYFPVYDALIEPLEAKPISLLEIGVQNGGSLELWAKCLPRARRIVGCDIDPLCGQLAFSDPRIKLVVGDVNKRSTFDRIVSIAARYAMVIDDGSHMPADVVASFARYFPLVAPGGVYVIEDLHCAYYRSHHGRIQQSGTAIELLKLLVDVINYEHWRKDLSMVALLRSFFPGGRLPRFITDGSLHAIAFQNSLAVVRRARSRGHRKLGRRVIVGDSAIFPAILQLRRKRP